MDDRDSGKTTKLMEKAVELLGELPETHRVFITGAHGKWLFQLAQEFKAAGLVNVEFFSPTQIIHGALRGRRGVLLVDDEYDLTPGERLALMSEQKNLKNRS